ncbi:hypothetical protein EJ08DRAFT_699248 [Tothia fuscella]|uniref:Uncharacterized protein n=1 Tax=Tothia fuscella TaxID=1048955 RepID=A0A9P4NMV6_9PEZI|nr:hypothetical protein EJ08DRAFT_699248 [Tothia fuscella]
MDLSITQSRNKLYDLYTTIQNSVRSLFLSLLERTKQFPALLLNLAPVHNLESLHQLEEIRTRKRRLEDIVSLLQHELVQAGPQSRHEILEAIKRNWELTLALEVEERRLSTECTTIWEWARTELPNAIFIYRELESFMSTQSGRFHRPAPVVAGTSSDDQLPKIKLSLVEPAQSESLPDRKNYKAQFVSFNWTNGSDIGRKFSSHLQLSDAEAERIYDSFLTSTLFRYPTDQELLKLLEDLREHKKEVDRYRKARDGTINETAIAMKTHRDILLQTHDPSTINPETVLDECLVKTTIYSNLMLYEAEENLREARDAAREHGMNLDNKENWSIDSFLKPPAWACYVRKSSLDGREHYYNNGIGNDFGWTQQDERTELDKVTPAKIRDLLTLIPESLQYSVQPRSSDESLHEPDPEPMGRLSEDSDGALLNTTWDGYYLRARRSTYAKLKRKIARQTFKDRRRQAAVVDLVQENREREAKRFRQEVEYDPAVDLIVATQ